MPANQEMNLLFLVLKRTFQILIVPLIKSIKEMTFQLKLLDFFCLKKRDKLIPPPAISTFVIPEKVAFSNL